MTHTSNRLSGQELDSILRLLATASAHDGVDCEELEAYLAGTLDPDAKLRVQALLARSGDLREELLGLDAISHRSLEFQALPSPPVPRRRTRRFPTYPRVIMGLAAVLAVAFGVSYGVRQRAEVSLLLIGDQAYYGDQFVVDQTRGAEVAPAISPRNHRQAALLAFRQVLRWEDGTLTALPYPTRSPAPPEWTSLAVRTTTAATFHVNFPPDAKDPRVAVLSFPSLSLSWANLPPGERSFRISAPGQVFIAVAYQTSRGFAAELAFPN